VVETGDKFHKEKVSAQVYKEYSIKNTSTPSDYFLWGCHVVFCILYAYIGTTYFYRMLFEGSYYGRNRERESKRRKV